MTSQKAHADGLGFGGARTAIGRVRNRPNRGPTVLETIISIAVIADPTLPRAAKKRILTKPWTPPAPRKATR